MVIDRSLYGLKSSSARFHEHLSMRQMGYKPSKADPDLWYKSRRTLRVCGTLRCDIFLQDPMTIMKDLEKHYIMKVSENLSIILEM
jgi:hypothetical protein